MRTCTCIEQVVGHLKACNNGDCNANDLVLHHQSVISWKIAADRNPSQCQQKATTGTDYMDIEPPAGAKLGHASEGGNHDASRDEESPAQT